MAEYIFTDCQINPYLHYNTAATGELGVKESLRFNQKVRAWKDTDTIITEVTPSDLVSTTSKPKYLFVKDYNYRIPGSTMQNIFTADSDEYSTSKRYRSLSRYQSNASLNSKSVFDQLSEKWLEAFGGFKYNTNVRYTTLTHRVIREREKEPAEKIFDVDQGRGIIINATPTEVFEGENFITYTFQDQNAKLVHIQVDSTTIYENWALEDKEEISIDGRFFFTKRPTENEGVYEYMFKLPTWRDKRFVIGIIGFGSTDDEMTDAYNDILAGEGEYSPDTGHSHYVPVPDDEGDLVPDGEDSGAIDNGSDEQE